MVISLSYFVLIVFIFYYDSKIVKDKFSVIKIVSFFAMIESIIMFWFAINVDSIFNIVLREVSEKFISYENVIIAYLFSIISYSFIILRITCIGFPYFISNPEPKEFRCFEIEIICL